jgi:hypothetical protein
LTRSFINTAAFAVTMALAAAPGAAVAQNTVLNFAGTAKINDPNPAVGVGNALVIDFLQRDGGILVEGATPGTIEVGSEDFDDVSAGQLGTINDLVASSGPAALAPLGSFVQIGAYTFTLTGTTAGNAFGPISLFQLGSNVLAGFDVVGTVTGGAFGTTVRNFSGVFSTQFNNITTTDLAARIDAGEGVQSDYSARFEIAAAVVPEPSTYALLASGVVVLGAFARRRNQG